MSKPPGTMAKSAVIDDDAGQGLAPPDAQQAASDMGTHLLNPRAIRS